MKSSLFKTNFFVLFILLFWNKTKAQTEVTSTYSPDGVVNAMVAKGDTLIVGGNFSHVGKYTGGGALFTNTSDQPNLNFPKINGVITASTPDGIGGFYVYGSYYRESENPSATSWRLEHILANNTFETGFSLLGGSNNIKYILYYKGLLYIGASGTNVIAGQTTDILSAFDVSTKLLVSWLPLVTRTSGSPQVTRIFAKGNSLYIIGNFNAVGGVTRQSAASIQIPTGTVRNWNLSSNWTGTGYDDLLFYNDKIIIGGNFNDGTLPLNGQPNNCAIVDTLSGQSFRYLFQSGGLFGNGKDYLYWGAAVNRLAIKGDILFVYSAGTYDTRVVALNIPLVNISRTASFNSGVIWAKYFNASANASDIAVIGNSLFVLGGDFYNVYITNATNGSSADIERNIKGGVKLNVADGSLESWFPDPVAINGNKVYTMSVSGNNIFAGGIFSHVNGLDRVGVYMVKTTTETILPFQLNLSGYSSINALKLLNNTIYVGGGITPDGSQYSSVKAYDVNTAVQSSWNPPNLGTVYAIEANNQYVFVGGSLDEPSGGTGRQNLFAIDRTTGALSSWAPNPTNRINSLFLTNDQLYVGGYFTTISGQTRNRVASYNVSNLTLTTWNPNSDGTVNTINLKNGSIWLGGNFSNVGGTTKNLLAGVDPISGAINFNSNPSFYGYNINATNSKGCKIFLGGDFQANGTELCSMLSVFDLGTNTLLPTSSFCLVINGYRISALAMIGNDLYFGGRFEKINNNTKSLNIGRLSFPTNYFTPCTIANCANAFTLSSTVDDYSTGTYNQKSSLGITATNKVTGNSQVTLKSNSSILLLPVPNGQGFAAKPITGGYFKAEIGGCN